MAGEDEQVRVGVKVTVSVTLDEGTLKAIDARRGPMSRSEYIRRALLIAAHGLDWTTQLPGDVEF